MALEIPYFLLYMKKKKKCKICKDAEEVMLKTCVRYMTRTHYMYVKIVHIQNSLSLSISASLTHTHLHYYGTHDNERIYNMLKKIIFNIIFTFQNFLRFFCVLFFFFFLSPGSVDGKKKKYNDQTSPGCAHYTQNHTYISSVYP